MLSVGVDMLLLSWPMSPMLELSLGVADEVLVSVGVAPVVSPVGIAVVSALVDAAVLSC